MAVGDRSAELEELSEQECYRLLAEHNLGRLALVVEGRPEIFPVNYVVDGEIILFRTAAGIKLARAPMSYVAFEVDGQDEANQVVWSVMVKGVAHDVTTAIDSRSVALRRRQVPSLAPGERPHLIAIYPSEVTGRRFRPSSAEAGEPAR